MTILTLNGNWEFSQSDKNVWHAATVPGCVHTDLLAAGEIPEPYFRDNELALQWIGEKDWVYCKRFTVTAELLQHDKLILRCNSLDTLATIEINGQEIGRANNQFRVWEFDVKEAVQAGENEIVITFESALNYCLTNNSERYMHAWEQLRWGAVYP